MLGGNCLATILVTCSPHQMQYSSTQNTLEFGDRCKAIQKVFTAVSCATIMSNATRSMRWTESVVSSIMYDRKRSIAYDCKRRIIVRAIEVTVNSKEIQAKHRSRSVGNKWNGTHGVT